MTPSPVGPVHDVAAPIAADARRLLTGEQPILDVTFELVHSQLEPCLLGCAAVVLGELGVMQRLCRGNGHHPRVIAGIVDLAQSYGIASAEAIGVSGALVDRMRTPDEEEFARLISSARRTLSDQDLLRGATSLLAAATSYLADLLGEMPTDVHDEIHGSPTRAAIPH